MWFVGLVVGLLVGTVLQSIWAAAVLGVIGAVVAHKLGAGPPTRRQKAESDFSGDPSQALVSELQSRLDALERRVIDLERAQEGEAALPGEAAVVAPVKVAQAAPLVFTYTTASAPLPQAAIPVPPPSFEAATEAELPEQPANEPDSTLPMSLRELSPPPPPPPAVPWRERLPAPLAQLIFGGNTLVKLGVLILFLGLAFLLRYTAERVTVSLELRYAGVALVGVALLALGWWLRRKRADYALILQGAGIGVFYLTTLGAMKMHALIEPTAGFAFLFAVALLAALLAVLQDAWLLAVVAVLEGFSAPILASTGSNRPLGLFTYLLVLDVGIFAIAWFRAWRVLNLIGLVGTFTLAAGWAQRSYTDAQYGIVQPFLGVFFILFAVIGVLFARRTLFEAPANEDWPLTQRASDTLKRVGRVDSALVFGAPLAAFGLQYLLMRPWEFGAAFSALGFAAFYLLLGRFVFATQPRGLALLAEAYAIVGVIFGTLSIPLGLEGQWTGATWAIEAAGMYWLGVRQARPYARAFALLLLGGSVVPLLRAVAVSDLLDGPLLQGSMIGPCMLAASVFAMWAMWRGSQRAESGGNGWEALAASLFPWLGMAALVLLPWQWLPPMWAAAATALLALATFAVSLRPGLVALRAVVLAMQAFALVAFMATLHRGTDGMAPLGNGWQGMWCAALMGLSILATTVWSMRLATGPSQGSEARPAWPLAQSATLLAGVGLLHLAMLFEVDLPQVALIWPFTAAVVLWAALRIGHAPLAVFGGAVHLAAALCFVFASNAMPPELAAFAHLGFWTPLALGLTALVAGDGLRAAAQRAANPWCSRPAVLWWPVGWGLLWWIYAVLGESARVLHAHGHAAYLAAAGVAVVLLTSALANSLAARRDWRQLGQATLATLPGLALVAWGAMALAQVDNLYAVYRPSSALGWLAWPLALGWHLRLLRAQTRWVAPPWLASFHVAGLWLFVWLGARECQVQLGRWGADHSSWSVLGWVLVPVVVLWALRSQALLSRWPIREYRKAYLEWALAPVAVYLLGWCWVSNVVSAADAAPLPFVPVLNPLELGHWLVLAALMLWCKALDGSATLPIKTSFASGVASVTAWALVTGAVLRACHHYAGVPWQTHALWGSWLAQAALSITWALCGVAAMVLGHRRGSRPVWLGGAVLIGVVVLKLFFVELANQGGLFRIVSFIGVGILLLGVGYFAPVPPAQPAVRDEEAI